jgi:predicted dehydrogenase
VTRRTDPLLRERLILGQIGCGYWGPNLLRAFAGQVGCRLKWVAEVRAERQAYVREQFPDVAVTASWHDVVRDPDVDGVVVATPAGQHHEIAKAALLQGKHVLVEKPLATSTAAADELIALAAAKRRVLMVGHVFLYNPAVRYMKELISAGHIGDVLYVYAQRLNLGQVRSDVNAWWNLAPHDVSILLYLRDGAAPASVAVHGAAYLQPDVEDVVFAVLSWADGVKAHIHVSWLDPAKVRRFTVIGSRKMIVYNDVADEKIAVYDKGVDRVPKLGERMDFDHYNRWSLQHRMGDVLIPSIAAVEPLRAEARHFLECMRTGAVPVTGPRHARDVVAVLEAGQRSLKGGGQTCEPS